MTILERIVARKHEEAAKLPHLRPTPHQYPPRRSLMAAIEKGEPIALIAEIKRRSPSRPMLRLNFEPSLMAKAYELGGASALSVVTDEPDFGGDLRHLALAHQAAQLPILRKDFIVDVRQVAESKAHGADAILLIAACLDDQNLTALYHEAMAWDLEVLLEVHDETEVNRALDLEFPLLGINNRNLVTFEVDITTTQRLCRLLRRQGVLPQPLIVSESGLRSPIDIENVKNWGANAVLVGEGLLTEQDLENAARRLLKFRPSGSRAT